jgi:hypothetical protein
MRNFRHIEPGMRFGRWTVESETERRLVWRCRSRIKRGWVDPEQILSVDRFPTIGSIIRGPRPSARRRRVA